MDSKVVGQDNDDHTRKNSLGNSKNGPTKKREIRESRASHVGRNPSPSKKLLFLTLLGHDDEEDTLPTSAFRQVRVPVIINKCPKIEDRHLSSKANSTPKWFHHGPWTAMVGTGDGVKRAALSEIYR